MAIYSCPQCDARYNLSAAQIGPSGRKLKCAKCGHQWFAEPVADGKAAEEAPKTAEKPAETAPEPPPQTPATGQEATETPATSAQEGEKEEEPTAPDHGNEETAAATPPQAAAPDTANLAGFASLKRQPAFIRRLVATPLGIALLGTAAMLGLCAYALMHMFGGSDTPAPPRLAGLPDDAITPPGLVLSDIQRTLAQRDETWVLTISGHLTNTGEEALGVPEIRVQLIDKDGTELDLWPAEINKTRLEGGEATTWQARFLNPPLRQLATYRVFFRNAPALPVEAEPQQEAPASAPAPVPPARPSSTL